jgi:hypothetical protein
METPMFLGAIVFWLATSAIVGVFASQRRNRSGFGWFVLALVISPVLAFLLCAAMREAEYRISIGDRMRSDPAFFVALGFLILLPLLPYLIYLIW